MNRPHPASAHAGYGRLYRLAAGLLSGLLVCLMLTGCGYVWRGQEGSLSENSVLGNGSKTLKIKSVEQTSLYPWLTYQVRSLVRDDINARNLAKWVDDGQADYTLTVRIPSFKVRSYGQYRSASQLYTATISIEFIVYDGKTNTEVCAPVPSTTRKTMKTPTRNRPSSPSSRWPCAVAWTPCSNVSDLTGQGRRFRL